MVFWHFGIFTLSDIRTFFLTFDIANFLVVGATISGLETAFVTITGRASGEVRRLLDQDHQTNLQQHYSKKLDCSIL